MNEPASSNSENFDANGAKQDQSERAADASQSRPRWRRVVDHPLSHLVAAVLLIALVQGFLIKMYMVPSGSMEHTLEVGDRILVNRLVAAPEPGDIVVFTADDELWSRSAAQPTGPVAAAKQAVKWVFGDLLGFGPTTGHTLVKRVIAVGGQTVSCCDAQGRVIVDGEPLDEPYIFENPLFEPGALDCETSQRSHRCFSEVTVPEGMLLMLGDHRGASSDSIQQCRGSAEVANADPCVRWARESDVVGEAAAVVWPLSRFGGVE